MVAKLTSHHLRQFQGTFALTSVPFALGIVDHHWPCSIPIKMTDYNIYWGEHDTAYLRIRDPRYFSRVLGEEATGETPRYVQQQQRKVKKKIVGRKYFQEPQEVNLLTWNAKQQIRYLHQQLPEDWTPQQLAQSFPISEEGVRRLLKNSYVPRSEEEIAKHDRRVMAHRRQLRQTLALGSGPGEVTQTQTQTHPFQYIIEAGKLPLMINAGGSAQLAAPRERCAQRGGRMGVFESILAGSQDAEAQRVQKKIEGKGAGTELLKEIAGFRNRKEIPARFPDKSKHQR
ncbi:hypothetical protein ACOMHN_016765 [Nucella lapillus]